jgi:hypothetical protein
MRDVRGSYVLVKKSGLLYHCRQKEFGWICGHCSRGILNVNPRLKGKCKKCGAVVAEKRILE